MLVVKMCEKQNMCVGMYVRICMYMLCSVSMANDVQCDENKSDCSILLVQLVAVMTTKSSWTSKRTCMHVCTYVHIYNVYFYV